jgi:hypothetical protein
MSILKENVIQDRKKYTESTFLYHKYRMNGLKKCIQDTVDEIQGLTKKLSYMRKQSVQSPVKRDLAAESLMMLKLHQMEQTYRGQIREFNRMKAESEEALCRSVDVVGMTTTGAARRRDVLALLQPKIGNFAIFILSENNEMKSN